MVGCDVGTLDGGSDGVCVGDCDGAMVGCAIVGEGVAGSTDGFAASNVGEGLAVGSNSSTKNEAWPHRDAPFW